MRVKYFLFSYVHFQDLCYNVHMRSEGPQTA
nr:MAG TPA: hypothetical protein [Caudoviricetes sp.]